MMKSLFLLVLAVMMGSMIQAQQLDIPFLSSLKNADQVAADTLLQQKGYHLDEKETDSSSTLYYYTNVEKNSQGPSWVRSLSMIDAEWNGYRSRLVRYRTYDKDEFVKMNAYLLANRFRSKSKINLKNEEQVLYSNGTIEIRVKTIRNKLQDGRYIKSYEYEL